MEEDILNYSPTVMFRGTPCRFSLLINSLINLDRVDFEVSQRRGLRFYRFNALMLFCSPLQVHFSTLKHLLLALVFKK